MGKKESKIFRDSFRGKNGVKRSEEQELLSIYSLEEIRAAENRIVDREIAKRDKKIAKGKLKPIPQTPSQNRTYQYIKIVPSNGIINSIGITEEQFNDPSFLGLKKKQMISAYTDGDGKVKYITVKTQGKFTEEEQIEYDKIRKADMER